MRIEIEIKTIGEFLRHIRAQKTLSLRQVEEATGITKATLWRIEHDKNIVFISALKLLNFYNISLDTVKPFITSR